MKGLAVKKTLLRQVIFFVGSIVVGVLTCTLVRTLWLSSTQPTPLPRHIPSAGDAAKDESSFLTVHSRAKTKEAEALAKIPVVKSALWLATQAENAGPAELWRLLQLAEGHGDLQRAIAARWAAVDPRHMFETLWLRDIDGYDRILFETWSKSDPRGALKSALDMKNDATARSRGFHMLAEYLMRNEPEVGVEAMNTLGVRHFIPNMKSVADWTSRNPRTAAEKVATMNADYAGLEAMEEVGKAWGKSDPENAMAYAASLRDPMGYQLAESAMAAWTENDPDTAAEFAAAQTDPILRARLGQGLAAGLAKTDPATALDWAEENLKSAARANAIGSIVKTVAQTDIQAAADLVSNMTPGGAMNQAVEQLMRVWTRKDLAQNTALFTWLDGIDDRDTRDRAIQSVGWRLESYGKNGLIDFVSGDFGHLASESMLNRAAEQRTRQDPESAIAWAKGLPEDRSAKALEQVMRVRKSINQNGSL